MGGKKFGILTVPPLACLPSIRAGRSDNTCNEELDIISSLHNQKLSIKLQELEKQLEGFKYAKFDLSTAVSNRMNNPSKYGNSACCGSGPYRGIYSWGGKRGLQEYQYQLCDNINDYLFFDSFHPNEVANRQYAQLFWDADSNVTTPYNLKTLFQAHVAGPFRGIDSCGGKREVKEFELCDNINDYLFFDSNHCTEVANRRYAELFWDRDSSVTTPYNLKAFFHDQIGPDNDQDIYADNKRQ
ncbi:lipase, GDSL, partial [Tanacetum coccineum]